MDKGVRDASLLRVKRDLRRWGLLPFTDSRSPSLVSIVAGAPISGSWWGHPAGQAIYRVGEALESDPDALLVRLWRGKQTLVHRRLWPALERVGSARAPWQMTGLSAVGRRLLANVDRVGLVRSDLLPSDISSKPPGSPLDLRDLGERLLVLTRSVHTPSGAHALEAEGWSAWRTRVGSPRYRGSVSSAQIQLEEAARHLTPRIEPRPLFPWGRSGARGTSK
ncbi:MAG: hypothetical protein WCB19_09125 [Thermoplasmata archaeon]